jgi:hypothetical protein
LARRGSRPDMGEQFVFFSSEHGLAPFLRICGDVGDCPLPSDYVKLWQSVNLDAR